MPWGEKVLIGYLGSDRDVWREHDACALIEDGYRGPHLLVDQGEADGFLTEQLRTNLLRDACRHAGMHATIRIQPGYDHSYYFIGTLMAEHAAWHAAHMN